MHGCPDFGWGKIMTFIGELPIGEFRDVYSYWLGKRRAGGRVPLRRDLAPVEFPPSWMPNLFMYRVEGERFRCILAGTKIVEMFGRDETGLFLDEILPPEHAASRQRLFERSVRDRVPVYYAGPGLIPGPDDRRVARLLLPVSSDGVAADHIFGIVSFGPDLRHGPDDASLGDRIEPAKIAIATERDLDGSAS